MSFWMCNCVIIEQSWTTVDLWQLLAIVYCCECVLSKFIKFFRSLTWCCFIVSSLFVTLSYCLPFLKLYFIHMSMRVWSFLVVVLVIRHVWEPYINTLFTLLFHKFGCYFLLRMMYSTLSVRCSMNEWEFQSCIWHINFFSIFCH